MKTIFTSKFVQTLKTLSPEELKALENWLKSPWCNSNKNLILLLERLKKYYPDFDKPRLTKEKLFKQVLPNGKFSDRRMNNLLSEGYLSVERFLLFQNLRRNKNLQQDLLTQEFQNRHLEDWFFRDINKEIERLNHKPIKDWEDHLSLLQLHRRIYHHPNQHPRLQAGGTTILRMSEQVDLVYLLEKATIITEMISRNRILKNENHDVATAIKKWKTASEGIQHLSIELYQKRFDYTEDNRLEKYLELRAIFLERYKELTKKEQKIHLISLLNDTSQLVRAKQLEISEGLPLYQLGLKTEILLHQGIIAQRVYVAIVATSNTKKEFDFTQSFIENYTKKLKAELRQDGLYWAKAHTAYWQKNLEQSLDFLLEHNFVTPYFQLATKILTTQVYFDLHLIDYNYHTYLFNYFDSFEKYILRDKTKSETAKKGYLRFIQKCRTLAKYYSDVDIKIEKIKNTLHQESNIQAVNWLTQKVEHIIQLKTKDRPKFQ